MSALHAIVKSKLFPYYCGMWLHVSERLWTGGHSREKQQQLPTVQAFHRDETRLWWGQAAEKGRAFPQCLTSPWAFLCRGEGLWQQGAGRAFPHCFLTAGVFPCSGESLSSGELPKPFLAASPCQSLSPLGSVFLQRGQLVAVGRQQGTTLLKRAG